MIERDFGLWGRVCRSPQALGLLFIQFLGSTGLLVGAVNALGFTGLGALALGIGYVGGAGAALALQFALQRRPGAAQPSDVQANFRQAISPRRRIYGRFLTGSVIVFGFRRGERTFVLHYIGEGPIEGYVSYRLDRKPVTLDGSGFVTEEQYQNGGRSRVQILTTLGLSTDEPFQAILDAFPELNTPLTPFRHRGCAMVLQIVEQVPFEALGDVYPNNLPSLHVLVDGRNTILDPRTQTTALTDNAGLCLLAEAMDVYGLTAEDEDEIDFSAFADFADHCDDDIALKASGAEKRYRCAGVITLDAENEARLAAIAAICNADVYIDPQGRLSVRQRLRVTPGIALRHKNGDHLTVQIEGGRAQQKKFNRVNVTYTDPALNWKANVVAWRHAGMIEEDGEELPQPLGLTLCPSGTQAMRVAKLHLHEANPEFAGSIASGPQALDLLEDPVFTLDLNPEDGIERVALASGAIEFDAEAMTVAAGFMVPHDGAADWVPEEDEQEEVVVPPELPSNVDDIPLDVTVTVELLENSAPVLKFEWVAADGFALLDSYAQQVEVSAADAEDWRQAQVTQEDNTAQYGPVADGASYDWRIRDVAAGKTFDYQNSVTPVTVVVDSTPPQALLTFSASDGTGQFTANFGTENDSHLATVAIYKVASGGVLNRETDIVAPPYAVAPGIAYALTISSDAGSFDIYAEPFNRSSIAGPLSGPDGAVVS